MTTQYSSSSELLIYEQIFAKISEHTEIDVSEIIPQSPVNEQRFVVDSGQKVHNYGLSTVIMSDFR